MATTGTDRPFEQNHTVGNTTLARASDGSSFVSELDLSIRWRMAHALQSSLDLNTILDIFFVEVASIVPCDGLAFCHEDLEIEHEVGHQSMHTASYRVVAQQDRLGTVQFSRGRRFSEQDLAVFESLLGLLVFPICNALRYRQALASALVDPLTGAGNRGALDKALLREADRARRYEQCLAIAMIDLDHFKRINDGCGHVRGDEVLCAIVEAIQDDIRGSDSVYRYGGEEFVVLLPNTTAALAMRIAERLRCRIEALELSHNRQTVTTTVSIGVAMLQESDSVGRLLERADAALYRAKSNGRNMVRLASERETA